MRPAFQPPPSLRPRPTRTVAVCRTGLVAMGRGGSQSPGGRPERARLQGQDGATDTPRSLTSLTTSSLNSPLNFLLFYMPAFRFPETPYLGVHQNGSRPVLLKSVDRQAVSLLIERRHDAGQLLVQRPELVRLLHPCPTKQLTQWSNSHDSTATS